jgi:DNA-binding MarR family transcriptional regulator
MDHEQERETMSRAAITMAHRQMLDPLRSGEWKRALNLTVPVSAKSLDQMVSNGWIERRGEESQAEIRLTAIGLQALKAPLKPFQK